MNTLKMIAAAVALAMATPAMAQTLLKPQPMTAKYRDAGAKPATGRAGSAAIEARALMGIDGKTDIEVTTGRFDGIGGGGALGKVQVKLFSDGALVETDNYKMGPTGGGRGTYSYDGLYVGQVAQVQANVSGIDPNRTDVVTATTQVRRRPDLEAVQLQLQPFVVVNAPVTIQGTISEINGDVGARATCRFFADGVEIGAIPGAWVDASSAVTCALRTSFAALGTRNLTLRVTDVEPADYDASNNEATLAIEVVEANVAYQVWVQEYHFHTDHTSTQTWVPTGATRVTHTVRDEKLQGMGVWSGRLDEHPYTGRITVRHSSGGVALPGMSIAVQDLEYDGWGCAHGHLSQQYVTYCSMDGLTYVSFYRNANHATYFAATKSNGFYGEAYFENAWTDSDGAFLPLGSDYTVEVLHETEEGTYGGTRTLALVREPGSLHGDFCNPIFMNHQICISQRTDGWSLYAEAF